ncbi:hypothetical protein, partial [Holdemanella biformis]|uniref:hypothetical protein n=1 Tax=Holdemanella biformis TaxID=1735 RepID=UPI003A523293
MDEFILLNNFQIDANEIDWYKATKKAITPLIENGFVKVEYEEAIMENLKRAGSKFIISSISPRLKSRGHKYFI